MNSIKFLLLNIPVIKKNIPDPSFIGNAQLM